MEIQLSKSISFTETEMLNFLEQEITVYTNRGWITTKIVGYSENGIITPLFEIPYQESTSVKFTDGKVFGKLREMEEFLEFIKSEYENGMLIRSGDIQYYITDLESSYINGEQVLVPCNGKDIVIYNREEDEWAKILRIYTNEFIVFCGDVSIYKPSEYVYYVNDNLKPVKEQFKNIPKDKKILFNKIKDCKNYIIENLYKKPKGFTKEYNKNICYTCKFSNKKHTKCLKVFPPINIGPRDICDEFKSKKD